MILRSFAGAMLALAVAASPALACKGETEIYSDNFTDSGGPWEGTDNFAVGGGFATAKAEPGKNGVLLYSGGFVSEFDVCVDITVPATKGPNSTAIAGLLFWFAGNPPDLYAVLASATGLAGAIKVNNGKSTLVSPFRKQAAVKTGTGAKNTFRVTAKGNTVTVYANDQKLAGFRGNPTDGYLGFYAESEADGANEWKFSNFKLTEPPK